MKARIWGCRGSLATPGPETVRYGGNTPCLEIRPADGSVLVLDAGTGIRQLGIALMAERPRQIHLLLTHMHLDHVEGLGFFAPLFDPDCSVHVWGPRPDDRSLEDRIAGYVSPPLFPVPFERIPADITFTEVWGDEWEIGGVRIRSEPVRHPGRTVAYRLSENGSSLAFVPDNEPALERTSGLAIAADADVLLHDAQYTAAEYESRVGWGHSALPDFARFVGEAVPARVIMFHHDPTHSDDALEAMVREVRALTGRDDVELAREGLELVVG